MGRSLDKEGERPWLEDTLVPVASTGKVGFALCVLILADRGLIDLNAPVARYWPAFAQGGKGAVTVRQALSHQAGVPGLTPPLSPDEADFNVAAVERIAAEPHWFEGEPRLAYHAWTYVYLVGELIRRVDGRGPARFFREELAEPLGADFHMGLTDPAVAARRALPFLTPPTRAVPELVLRIARTMPTIDRTRPAFMTALSHAVANGRSIARLMSVVAGGGEAAGRRFISASLIDEMVRGETYQQCPLMGWMSMGLGVALDSPAYPAASPTTVHWGGNGGSWIVADPALGLALGYAPNNWDPSQPEGDARLKRIRLALEAVMAGL